MEAAINNGEKTRLQTIEVLNEHGCSYGKVNREKIDNLQKGIDSINNKLWAVLLFIAGEAGTIIFYLATH